MLDHSNCSHSNDSGARKKCRDAHWRGEIKVNPRKQNFSEEERREKQLEQQRKRRMDPDYRKAYNSQQAVRRRRRMADPVYREHWNEYWRERWATDAAYKASINARQVKRKRLMSGADCEVFDYLEVFERDGWICQLCFEPVDPALKAPHRWSATLDHIVPLSKGGPHTRDNAQLAHYSCNSAKKNRLEAAV